MALREFIVPCARAVWSVAVAPKAVQADDGDECFPEDFSLGGIRRVLCLSAHFLLSLATGLGRCKNLLLCSSREAFSDQVFS